MTDKMATDRELRDLIRDTKERTLAGVVSQYFLVAFFWAAFWGAGPVHLPSIGAVVILGLLLTGRICLIRHRNILRPRTWVAAYASACFASSLVWSYLCWAGAVETANGFMHVVSLMCIAGLTSAALQSLSLFRSMFLLFCGPLILTACLIVWTQAPGLREALLGVTVVLCFLVFLLYVRSANERMWRQKTRRSEELELILDSFPGGIALIRNGEYARVNCAFARLLGLQPRLVEQRPLSVLKEEAPELTAAIEEFRVSPANALTGDFRLGLGGRRHWVLLHSLPQHRDLSLVLVLDVEEQRGIEDELEKKRAQIVSAAKMAALGEMAAGLAHEINNPMAIISGHAQLIRRMAESDDVSSERLRGSVETIHRTIERVASIIRGLRGFARDSAGDPMEKTNLRRIVEDTVVFCEARFRHHGVRLEIDWSEAADIKVPCRPAQLSQVLLNFLNNSFDAVQSVEDRWIRISFEKDASLRLMVTDAGPGIPEGHRARLLEPFFTTKPVGQGTGLGLSISHGIAGAHGGRVYFDHEAPNTKVCLEIPFVQTVNRAS